MAESKDDAYVVGKTEKILSNLEDKSLYGEANTGYTKNNVFNTKQSSVSSHEFPIGNEPPFVKRRGRPIIVNHERGINDHILKPTKVYPNERHPLNTREHYVPDESLHSTRDVAQNLGGETEASSLNPNEEAPITAPTKPGKETRVFSGATTQMNPTRSPYKAEILNNGGLDGYAREHKIFGTYNKPPISPLHPFTRMNSDENRIAADESVFNTYNRTKLPIADVEWRKGFRHIFITRPECYLTYRNAAQFDLCDQAAFDDDFQSAFLRMPHIIRLLSPWYVTGSIPKTNVLNGMNWNYLLSNRVTGLSAGGSTLTINENVGKSVEGFTVIPAMHLETRQGSSIELTFTDTKNLEVYETARLWMLYMYKRKKGIFIPPMNGYAKTNDFLRQTDDKGRIIGNIPSEGKAMSGTDFTQNHPYDRALEYCASLYDIVTNETGTKILYWCKYYGIYPISVTPGLDNDNNAPITEMKTKISFKYHYKLENANNSLIEFNHDAGLTDAIGRLRVKVNKDTGTVVIPSEVHGLNENNQVVTSSESFLLRDDPTNGYLPKYIGAAGMFTGSPYIVIRATQIDPTDRTNRIYTPQLRFMATGSPSYDGQFNVGLVNDRIDDPAVKNVIAYESAQTGVTSDKYKENEK